ncbi:MAG: filamentous hemagglutinin N-terminal domain-containing protein [Myxococcota bacterium]
MITPNLGELVGHNLFHSFSRFDLASGEIASFTGPKNLENIVARVTGNDLSEIYGIVRVAPPAADLYLLNPAGILFGQGASLWLSGSFHASTGDRLEFTGDERFEARFDGATPTLSTALPGEFGFLDNNTAPISVDPSTFLGVRDGATLSLEGAGAVTVRGSISAQGGDICVRAGGDIRIEDSTLSVVNPGPGAAGVLDLEARGSVEISRSLLEASSTGSGDAGTIELVARGTAPEDGVSVDNSWVGASAFGSGAAGTVTVEARRLSVSGVHPIFGAGGVVAESAQGGLAGTITLTVGKLDLRGGALISTTALGEGGVGGAITVHANDAIVVSNVGGGPFNLGDVLERRLLRPLLRFLRRHRRLHRPRRAAHQDRRWRIRRDGVDGCGRLHHDHHGRSRRRPRRSDRQQDGRRGDWRLDRHRRAQVRKDCGSAHGRVDQPHPLARAG